MSTSPAFQYDFHDWRRILESFTQAFIAFLIAWVLHFVPLTNFGMYQPLVMALLLPLTEAVKRYVQSPEPIAVIPA